MLTKVHDFLQQVTIDAIGLGFFRSHKMSGIKAVMVNKMNNLIPKSVEVSRNETVQELKHILLLISEYIFINSWMTSKIDVIKLHGFLPLGRI